MMIESQNPLISVLMPCYNAMPLLKASIKSLLNQSYKNWECVIVDDGSTDGSGEYIDSLKDNRFRVFHFDKNMGRPTARQKTLDEARGEYIAMLDAGDLYHPDKLAMQLDLLNEFPEAVLISSAMCSFGTKTQLLRKRGVYSVEIKNYEGITPCHASSLIVASYAKNIRYNPRLKLGQDSDFLDRLLIGKKFVTMPNVTYYYSEFDSVSKKKIRRTYKLNYIKQFKNKEYKQGFYSLFQYVVSGLIFPFIPDEELLKRRGEELSESEIKDFNEYCDLLLNNIE